jgi:Domain of unknown function (DUF4602)
MIKGNGIARRGLTRYSRGVLSQKILARGPQGTPVHGPHRSEASQKFIFVRLHASISYETFYQHTHHTHDYTMASTVGKRKRTAETAPARKRASSTATAAVTTQDEEAQEIFRRHFESQFAPIDEGKTKVPSTNGGDHEMEDMRSSDEEDDAAAESNDESTETEVWEGLSSDSASPFNSDEEDLSSSLKSSLLSPTPIIVSHTRTSTARPTLSKAELKAFRTGKLPPSAAAAPKAPRNTATSTRENDAKDEENQNKELDLSLHRLLTESHLLSPSSSSSSLSTSGAARHKAHALRLSSLGSKISTDETLAQRMPLSHRKGIVAKRVEKEGKRRKDAYEAGIILERAGKGKVKERKREKGVDGPAVGRMRGATLSLSKKDIFSIEGSKKKVGGRR